MIIGTTDIVLLVVIVPVVTFYMLLDWDRMVTKINDLLPLDHAATIRQIAKDEVVTGFSESLQIGMQVFYALKEIGCLYQVDPTSPFTAVQENPLSDRYGSDSGPRSRVRRSSRLPDRNAGNCRSPCR